MNVAKTQFKKVNEVANRMLILRDGNIVAGKITKIHLNNQVDIQIGNHKITAKVLTPLTIGERYFFQVQQKSNQIIQLKVIGNALQADQTENVSDLLQRLGLKASKQNVQFVQSLINNKIPFTQSQLTQAIDLLNRMPNISSDNLQQIIQFMIANKLPLTESTFNALHVVQQQSISQMGQEVIAQLQNLPTLTSIQSELLHSLQQLLGQTPRGSFSQIVAGLSSSEQMSLFSTLQQLGVIPETRSFNNWITSLEQIDSNPKVTKQVMNSSNELLTALSQLVNNRQQIQSVVQIIMATFYPSGASQSLNDSQLTILKNVIQEQLFPLLPAQAQQHLLSIFSSNQSLSTKLYHVLSTLSQQGTVDAFASLSTLLVNDEMTFSQTNQSQFLSYIKQYISTLGLSDEFQLNEQLRGNLQQILSSTQIQQEHQSQSIKSLILQMIQQGTHQGTPDKAQQLLHFINGMQLQSLQESPHLFQALLQIPGEKFGAYGDMMMKFEGQKTQDGKLNSDFCRILFLLDLGNIKETIIDMHVQKRMISISIFNDFINDESVKPLQNKLKEDLASLNFDLSSITVQKLEEREAKLTKIPTNNKERPKGEGIEFFV